jgi:GntR family transcriptional regulator
MNEIETLKKSLNSKSPIPLYYQIEEKIREHIQTGIFLPGQKIPSENEMYSILGVSRNTIRKVYQDLNDEGLIEKQQGKGTFVCVPKISHKFVTVVSFTQELIARGITPTSTLLSLVVRLADEDVADKLQIETGKPVFYIERLRYGNEKLLGYNLNRVPEYLCPGLDKVDIKNESLYTLIEKEYGHTVVKADRTMETIPADAFVANTLNIKEGYPVLKIVGVAFNQERHPFDYCIEYYID